MGNVKTGNPKMGNDDRNSARAQTNGFTLIASLLLLLLLSGIAIGLMMMVNTEGKVGSTDLQNNAAFRAAEGGVEKMTSDLASTFQNAQSPTASQICNLSTQYPTIAGVTWKDYSVTPASGCTGTLTANFGQITSGPNQGLYAQIIPVNMLATAAEPGGQEVSMTRSTQVALIPVFQFGIFSDSDLSFFSGPNFDFAGRIHTNGDLYPEVGPGSTLTFHDKISVYGNVVRTQLANGYSTTVNYNGTVKIPTQSSGCDGAQPYCQALPTPTTSSPYGNGSVQGGGGNPPNSAQYSGWTNVSLGTATGDYNREIIDGNYGNTGGTGAKKLKLPFVGGSALPNELIRQPAPGEDPTSSLALSRQYNLAQIHILLADNPANLPGGASDVNNVRLANLSGSNPYGIATSTPTGTNSYVTTALPALAGGATYTTMFAMGYTYVANPTGCAGTYCTSTTATLPQDWLFPPATPPSGAASLVPTGAPTRTGFTYNSASAAPTLSVCHTGTCVSPYYSTTANASNAVAWNLIDGYLRVEYKDASGNWHPVTMEWLNLGFARGMTPPTASYAGTPSGGTGNPINPKAILLLQEPADRNGDGAIDMVGKAPTCLVWGNVAHTICTTWSYALPPEVVPDNGLPTSTISPWFSASSTSMYQSSWTGANYYPINFYDDREGEVRDTNQLNNSCTSNGLMNAVEIDVGNLKQWLMGNIGTSGPQVDYLKQNGYVLYFSDRRGMLSNPTAGYLTGDAGLEDVVNRASTTGVPDGVLEAIPTGYSLSPEDVNQNGVLDEYGTANLGLGQYNGTTVSTNQNTQIVAASPDNPYLPRMTSCANTGRKNWVSGARHVLKLVDGALGNVPLRTDAAAPNTGGFTVASEEPLYVQGNYNSSSSDTVWNSTPTDTVGHSAASVIADAVTLLSNNWNDEVSMTTSNVTAIANRPATTTYYRMAVAGGKNINFPLVSYASQDFGTDGGVHNFLRYLESWSGQTLYYKGSLVSLFYSTYNTGTFKCCTTVYGAPVRNFSFDSDFTNPSGLPPGTPLLSDVDSLGYRQSFAARTY